MIVRDGFSYASDVVAAVAEASANWEADPEIVFSFASTVQDAAGTAMALKSRFPKSVIAGCSTSGEHLGKRHLRGSLVLSGLYQTGMRWRVPTILEAADFDETRATTVVSDLLAELGADQDSVNADDYLAILMVDGLSLAEERLASCLAEALQGIPLVGGSAGDDLAFHQTFVIGNDGAHSGAALLVLAERGTANISILKHQHFVATPTLLAVTRADPQTRTVFEIDGRPAIEAYAEAIEMPVASVTSDVSFMHPLTFCFDGQLYVRSIQTINDDGSLTFYCAIEEGMVLDIAASTQIGSALDEDMSRLSANKEPADFILSFNCILRALEAETANAHDQLGCNVAKLGKHVVGFDTYGEQLNGLHINQTLVAVAIRGGTTV